MNTQRLLAFLFLVLFTSAFAQEDNDDQAEAMMKMFGSSDIEVQDNYKFDHRFVILMEDFDKKGKLIESSQMAFLSKEGSSMMGLELENEETESQMVYDLEKYEMITLMTTGGQKFGTTQSLDKDLVESMAKENAKADVEMMSTDLPKFKKTGKTKEISGYDCEEYKVTNMAGAKEEVIYWITDEASADWITSMSNMSGLNKQLPSMYSGSGYPEDGSVIQMIINEGDGKSSVMTVKEIQKDKNINISTEGYTFMNIPGSR